MWKWLTAAAVVCVLTGLLPVSEAQQVLHRIAPVLVFLAAITVVAELADAATVFDVAADRAARAARGSVPGLFALTAALATVITMVLSLDTTAVLLTPIVITLARRIGLSPVPFAVLTLWLANTASLLLPVSNLTNLLAVEPLSRLEVAFPRLMAAPAATALVITVAVIAVRYRRDLHGRYSVPTPTPVPDRALFTIAALTCLAIGPLFAAGADVAVVATAAALLLLAVFAIRGRRHLTSRLLPWRLVLTTIAMFLLVQTALEAGAHGLLTSAAGSGTAFTDLLRLTGVAAGAANLVNNLPAYLALEPTAQASPARLAALLIGTNAGPLVLPWGSLATLLWLARCRARNLHVPARQLAALALVGVPLVTVGAVLALTATYP